MLSFTPGRLLTSEIGVQNLSTAYQTATAEFEKGLDGVLAVASEGGTHTSDPKAQHTRRVVALWLQAHPADSR